MNEKVLSWNEHCVCMYACMLYVYFRAVKMNALMLADFFFHNI